VTTTNRIDNNNAGGGEAQREQRSLAFDVSVIVYGYTGKGVVS
jgi:hypothetical protein